MLEGARKRRKYHQTGFAQKSFRHSDNQGHPFECVMTDEDNYIPMSYSSQFRYKLKYLMDAFRVKRGEQITLHFVKGKVIENNGPLIDIDVLSSTQTNVIWLELMPRKERVRVYDKGFEWNFIIRSYRTFEGSKPDTAWIELLTVEKIKPKVSVHVWNDVYLRFL